MNNSYNYSDFIELLHTSDQKVEASKCDNRSTVSADISQSGHPDKITSGAISPGIKDLNSKE